MENAKSPKSLYDSSPGEIAMKNFLAGFSRGLGGFVVTLLTWAALYYFSIRFILPQLTGVLSETKGMIQSAQQIQNGFRMPSNVSDDTNLMTPNSSANPNPTALPAGGIVIPPEMIKQFQQLQNSNK